MQRANQSPQSISASIFRATFKSLSDVPLKVVYPTFNSASLDVGNDDDESDAVALLKKELGEDVVKQCSSIFLSLNRFERKKNITLAVQSFGEYRLEIFPVNFEKKFDVVFSYVPSL